MAAKHSQAGVAAVLLSVPAAAAAVEQTTASGGRTALHLAASEGCTELVELLLGRGATPRARATQDWTPLHFAAREGHTEVCRLLVRRGAKVRAFYWLPVKSLRWQVNTRTAGGWTALMLAASFNRQQSGQLLLSAGAVVSSLQCGDEVGETRKKPFLNIL